MINIKITEYNFEHDLYSLVRSFYPGTDTVVEIIPLSEGADPYIEISFGSEEKIDGDDSETVTNTETGENTDIASEASITIELPEAAHYESLSRIELKTYVKRRVYEALRERTGRTLAWGTLTGIRPAKLATGLIEQGKNEEEILRYLRDHYLVSPGKASLALEVARKEGGILKRFGGNNSYSLYIGIPFCPTRCLYCSFTSFPLEKWAPRVDEYVEALCKELKFVSKACRDKKLETIYMGGGTPTTLSAAQMDRVLTAVEEYFDITVDGNAGEGSARFSTGSDRPLTGQNASGNYSDNKGHVCEFTVEAGRPDSITRDKLQVIYDHGIRRISVNPQTMQQKTLDLIGRRHTVDDIYRAFAMAREIGFDNINMDLIVGLPGETYEDVEDTMRQIREIAPDSLTVHSLAIKRAARLNTMKEAYADYKITNTQEMIDLTYETAIDMGLAPYYMYRQKNMAGNFENVGYSQEGKECVYNILIMEEKQSIIACGAGASTKLVIPEENRIERIENVKDVGQYLERIDEMIERKERWLCH